MKKIAKGVTLLFITLFLLMTTSIICFAADEESTEIKPQDNFTIENSLDRNSVKIYVENNVLYIENQSSKDLGKIKVTVSINDDSVSVEGDDIAGFGTYSLNLTDCFSEDYINENNVNITVGNYSKLAYIILIALYIIPAIIIVVIAIASSY